MWLNWLSAPRGISEFNIRWFPSNTKIKHEQGSDAHQNPKAGLFSSRTQLFGSRPSVQSFPVAWTSLQTSNSVQTSPRSQTYEFFFALRVPAEVKWVITLHHVDVRLSSLGGTMTNVLGRTPQVHSRQIIANNSKLSTLAVWMWRSLRPSK